jgi:hypothetical protein
LYVLAVIYLINCERKKKIENLYLALDERNDTNDTAQLLSHCCQPLASDVLPLSPRAPLFYSLLAITGMQWGCHV